MIVKYCKSCDEGFAERFGFCPTCGGVLEPFEMRPVDTDFDEYTDQESGVERFVEAVRPDEPPTPNARFDSEEASQTFPSVSGGREIVIGVLRWMGVLPGAILAYFLIQVLNAVLMGFFGDSSDTWIQLVNSFAGPYCFVWLGAMIAPRRKLPVAVILSVIVALFTLSLIPLSVGRESESYPIWWLILTGIVGVFGTIAACVKVKEDDPG
jgi:hypothetical protein